MIIQTLGFVYGFNSEQRFHETLYGSLMLQRHIRCSSVQLRMTIKIFLVKNDVLLSMHYLTLAALSDHAVSVYNCEMFCFYRYDARASQICVNFTRDAFLVSQEKK